MRTAFFRALMDVAEHDSRVHLVVGDLGFGVVEPFAVRFPQRFLNVGVAEQNMTGVAAGMALAGKIVFTYSIGNFPTLRCLEQIRNDVCYHQADVKIVAVGSGFSYGALGATHHATEDLAMTRALPGLLVVAPGDPVEADRATRAVADRPGPCYLRLGRSGEKTLHQPGIAFRLGKAIKVRDGDDVSIISTGAMLETAVSAAERLDRRGVSVRVLSMHTVQPIDTEAILTAARETRALVTLEEHSITGGVGSAVAEVLAESAGARIPFRRIGIEPGFAPCLGSQEYLRAYYGLTASAVAERLEAVLHGVLGRSV